MSDTALRTDVAPVTDRRPVPAGVLPRGMQTWLMLAVAVAMLAVILLTGRREPPVRSVAAPAPAPTPNPDRVRDYQDRLRALDARAAQEAGTASLVQGPARPAYEEPAAPRAEDPIVAERRRRNYESLFASNVVLSHRPEVQRPDSGAASARAASVAPPRDPASPSIDDIADAAVRASTRARTAYAAAAPVPGTSGAPPQPVPYGQPRDAARQRALDTDAITDSGPRHRILEGTIIDTVLTNRLDGDMASPVNCLVTNAVYSHSGQQVLIPAGARILGETKPVQAQGETRLAVAFHRLLMPDGSTFSLDLFPGLNQIGDAGLRDQVNNHYLSTFGAAAAVGLISGFAQFVGTAGVGLGEGNNRTVVIAGSVADATAQATMQTMNKFLNRLPTITIREGHRVKVYLTGDLALPEYKPSPVSSRF